MDCQEWNALLIRTFLYANPCPTNNHPCQIILETTWRSLERLDFWPPTIAAALRTHIVRAPWGELVLEVSHSIPLRVFRKFVCQSF